MPNEIQIAFSMDGTGDMVDYQDYVCKSVGMEEGIEVVAVVAETPSRPPRQAAVFRVLGGKFFPVGPGSPPPNDPLGQPPVEPSGQPNGQKIEPQTPAP